MWMLRTVQLFFVCVFAWVFFFEILIPLATNGRLFPSFRKKPVTQDKADQPKKESNKDVHSK
jgi:hypothetical protein